MCIRDSMKAMMTSFTDAITKGIESKFTEIMEQVEKQLTKGIQTAMEQMIGNISSGMQAVSYTHLDVYKRQRYI